MLNPDEIPLPLAVPLILLAWTVWIVMLASERRRERRAVSRFLEQTLIRLNRSQP